MPSHSKNTTTMSGNGKKIENSYCQKGFFCLFCLSEMNYLNYMIMKIYQEKKIFSEEEIRKATLDFLTENTSVSRDSIRPDSSFIRDLSMDSLERVEFIMWVERTFSVCIDSFYYDKLDTLRQTVDVVMAQQKLCKNS